MICVACLFLGWGVVVQVLFPLCYSNSVARVIRHWLVCCCCKRLFNGGFGFAYFVFWLVWLIGLFVSCCLCVICRFWVLLFCLCCFVLMFDVVGSLMLFTDNSVADFIFVEYLLFLFVVCLVVCCIVLLVGLLFVYEFVVVLFVYLIVLLGYEVFDMLVWLLVYLLLVR